MANDKYMIWENLKPTIQPKISAKELEAQEYNKFLENADEKFKEIYLWFPKDFREFAKGPGFSRLKCILENKSNNALKYDSKILKQNKKYIIKHLTALKNALGGPYKKRCLSNNKITWNESFANVIEASLAQSTDNKLTLRIRFKELVIK